MHMIARIRVAAAAALCSSQVACPSAAGQVGVPAGVGDRAIAWWTFDPGPMQRGETQRGAAEAGAAVFESAARVALAGGLVRDTADAPIIKVLLAASTVATTPHTLCVLRVGGGGAAGEGAVGEVAEARAAGGRLGLVLHLRRDRDHRGFVRSIESVLAGGAAERGGVQRPIGLPGGRPGMTYTEAGWPPERSVSWCSDRTGFVVGLGAGALEAWFEAMDALATEPAAPWQRHLGAVMAGGSDLGANVLWAWIDLDALRRLAPDRIGGGTVATLLESSRLCNARCFMILARLLPPAAVATRDPAVPVPPALRDQPAEVYAGPPVLAIDATWTVRSEDPTSGRVYRLGVGQSFWPAAEIGVPQPAADAGWVLVARAEVRGIVEQCLALARAMTPEVGLAAFDGQRAAWAERHHSALDRCAAAAGWIVVTPAGEGNGPLLGPLLVQVSLRPGSESDAVLRDVRDLLTPFESMIREDHRSRTTVLLLGPTMMFRAVAWGIEPGPRGPVLLGGVDLGPGGGLGRGEQRIVERARGALSNRRVGDGPAGLRRSGPRPVR